MSDGTRDRRARRWALIGAGAALLASRAAVRPEFPFDVDSVLLVAGVGDFDPSELRPHPPGYPGLIVAARLAGLAGLGPLDALQCVSVVASLGLVAATFGVARALGAPRPWQAAVLVAAAPVAWLHGAIANAYVLGAALATCLLWAALRGTGPAALGVLFGAACATRPTLILFAAPLCLVAVGRRGLAPWAGGALLFGVPALGWCVAASGGPAEYLAAIVEGWGSAVGLQSRRVSQLHLLAVHALQAVAGCVVLLGAVRTGWARLDGRSRRLLVAWGAPLLLVPLWSDGHGYVLFAIPVLIALAAVGGPSARPVAAAAALSAAWFLLPRLPPPPPCVAGPPLARELRFLALPSAGEIAARGDSVRARRGLVGPEIEAGRTAILVDSGEDPAFFVHHFPEARVLGPDADHVLVPAEGTRLLVVACERPDGGPWSEVGRGSERIYATELTEADRGRRPAGRALKLVH